MRDYEQEEFVDFLKQLIAVDALKQPALGIVKFVIDNGESKLSDKQAFVFKKEVVDVYTARCPECGEQVRWSEAYEFYHSGDRCGDCQVRYDKFMAED